MRTIAMEPFQLSEEIQCQENFHKFYEKQHSAPGGLEGLSRQDIMSCVESNVSQTDSLTRKAYQPPLLKILPPTPDQGQTSTMFPNSPFAISPYKPYYKTNNNFAALLASSSPPDHHRSSSELVPAVAPTSEDRTTASPAKQHILPAGHARTESLGMKMSQSPKVGGDGSNNNSLTSKDINNGVCRRSSDSDLSITPKGEDFFYLSKILFFFYLKTLKK